MLKYRKLIGWTLLIGMILFMAAQAVWPIYASKTHTMPSNIINMARIHELERELGYKLTDNRIVP